MKRYILFIIVLGINIICNAQSVSEMQEWASKQQKSFTSEDIVTFFNASRAGGEITFTDSIPYVPPTAGAGILTKLDESRFAIVRSYQNYTTAMIGTIQDSTISFGPEHIFNNGDLTYFSMCSLDSNTIAMVYEVVPNWPNKEGRARIAEVSGNMISFGPEYTFHQYGTWYISVSRLDSEHFVAAFHDYLNTDSSYVFSGTVTGTSIAFGNKFLFSGEDNTVISTTSLDASCFAICYGHYGNSAAIAGTLIGDSIVLGPENIISDITPWYMATTSLNDSCFVVAYNEAGYSTKARVGMIDNNIISMGDATEFESLGVTIIFAATMDNYHFVL